MIFPKDFSSLSSFRSSSKRGGYGVKGVWMGDIVISAIYDNNFVRVHKNLVQHPSNEISIPYNLSLTEKSQISQINKTFFSRKPAPKSVLIARGQYQLKQQDEFDDNCIYLPGGLTYRYSYLLV